ncbi:putative U3 small nucleolar RNA-associated protein 6 [Nannochloris sp. 'desiccata']|nr:putative U3 small nucleolar RNA-associated protein 6 [Chlorella desiccata (nom. nud.)]
MADTVRRVLEEMVPELEDLEQRGYFNKNEIKQIVQKRQDFEYNLRRRAALKADFLRYIEYENKLERLRQIRRKQRSIDGPSTLADHCIVRRTHFIFERALRKFRGDLSLWSRWLKFCQDSKSTRQISRVLTRALQLHPNCASLWTYAAAWEFEHNANAVAARALMQRGIRMCKDAPSLWHEYFRMELLYAARLVARRQVLGLTIDKDTDIGATMTSDQDAAAALVLKGAVAKVVYNSAIDTIRDSLEFRAGFLEVLQSVELPAKEELETFILNDIAAVFENTPGAVALQARRAMAAAALREQEDTEAQDEGMSLHAIQAGLEVFSSSLQESSSRELYDKLIEYLEEHIQTALEWRNTTSQSGQIAAVLVQECIKVITEAKESGHASPQAVLTLTRAHLRLGQLNEALQAAGGVKIAALERQHMGLHATTASLSGTAGTAAAPTAAVLEKALRESFNGGRRVELWYTALRIAVASNEPLETFGKLLIEQQSGSAKGPVQNGMGGAAAALFTAMWTTAGPKSARKFYTSLFKVPSPGGELVHAILDAELALLQAAGSSGVDGGGSSSSCLSLAKIRDVFEAGVAAHGHADEDLWLRYLKFEQMHDSGKKAGTIHWRAVKALEAPDAFVARASFDR